MEKQKERDYVLSARQGIVGAWENLEENLRWAAKATVGNEASFDDLIPVFGLFNTLLEETQEEYKSNRFVQSVKKQELNSFRDESTLVNTCFYGIITMAITVGVLAKILKYDKGR